MKRNKLFVETFSMIKNPSICIVILFALVSYGYAISHFAIGVDDTDMRLYYETGFAVNSGRWTLFFLNRILHLNIAFGKLLGSCCFTAPLRSNNMDSAECFQLQRKLVIAYAGNIILH